MLTFDIVGQVFLYRILESNAHNENVENAVDEKKIRVKIS